MNRQDEWRVIDGSKIVNSGSASLAARTYLNESDQALRQTDPYKNVYTSLPNIEKVRRR